MSSTAPTLWKQAAEARTVTFDFGSKMNTGDTVLAVVGGAVTAPAGVTVSSPVIVLNKVQTLVSGGLASVTAGYRLECRVTTTQGETLELDVIVRIAEGAN